MTTGDRDDVVAGCVAHLRALPTVTAVVGSAADGSPLIAQDQAPERDELTGQVAVVIAYAGPAAGNDHNTYAQVRLLVELWADPIRDDGGYAIEPSQARRAMVTAWQVIDRALHRPQGGAQRWGALTTIDCTRLAGLTPYVVPDADGLWRGTAFYAVGLA